MVVAKKYWEKYYDEPEGILETWDRKATAKYSRYVHFKVKRPPRQVFEYVITVVKGMACGVFRKVDVVQLGKEYLKEHDLADDFGEGWYIRCDRESWRHLSQPKPAGPIRLYVYADLSEFE